MGLSVEQGLALLHRQGVAGDEATLTEFVTVAEGHPLLLNLAIDWLLDPDQEPGERRLSTDAVTLFKTIVGQHRGDTAASVGKAFEASVQCLTPRLQNLLMDVSVYRRSFSLAAAQAMLPAEAEPLTIAELRSLEKRSFLLRQADGQTWQFQPLIKRYLQQREGGNVAVAHERAIAYYRSIAKTEVQLTDTKAAVDEYLEIFYHHYELQQYAQAFEAVRVCDQLLELRGYNRDLVQLYEQLRQSWQPTEAEQEPFANLLNNLGTTSYSLGQYREAIAYHQQSLEIQRRIEDVRGEAATWFNLGNSMAKLDQKLEAAIPAYKNARRLYQKMGLAKDVEKCDTAIREVGQVIAARPRQAPDIGTNPPEASDWYAQSLPTPAKSHPPQRQRSHQSSRGFWAWLQRLIQQIRR